MEQNSSLTEPKRGQAANRDSGKDYNVYDDGVLRVEHDNYYVACAGRRVALPLKDFLILSRLTKNPERVVTSCELWQHAWGIKKPVNGRTLRVHIHSLRQKLAPFGINIESMVNVGYRLSVNPAAIDQANG